MVSHKRKFIQKIISDAYLLPIYTRLKLETKKRNSLTIDVKK